MMICGHVAMASLDRASNQSGNGHIQRNLKPGEPTIAQGLGARRLTFFRV
jgi:hypothetical protein